MKKFKLYNQGLWQTLGEKISLYVCLIFFALVFSFSTAVAQAPNSTEQNTETVFVPSETTSLLPQNTDTVSIEKKIAPAVSDALINIKDEQKYFEQKKSEEQQKNNANNKSSDGPK
jgi:hypothetical protein